MHIILFRRLAFDWFVTLNTNFNLIMIFHVVYLVLLNFLELFNFLAQLLSELLINIPTNVLDLKLYSNTY